MDGFERKQLSQKIYESAAGNLKASANITFFEQTQTLYKSKSMHYVFDVSFSRFGKIMRLQEECSDINRFFDTLKVSEAGIESYLHAPLQLQEERWKRNREALHVIFDLEKQILSDAETYESKMSRLNKLHRPEEKARMHDPVDAEAE